MRVQKLRFVCATAKLVIMYTDGKQGRPDEFENMIFVR
jgi:hypothetical protein